MCFFYYSTATNVQTITIFNFLILFTAQMHEARDIELAFICTHLFNKKSSFLCSPKIFGGAYSRRLVRPSVRPICVRPITL